MSLIQVEKFREMETRLYKCGQKNILNPKRNKWKRVLNRPRLNSAIDFRLLAVLELTKVNEKQRLAQGGFEPA